MKNLDRPKGSALALMLQVGDPSTPQKATFKDAINRIKISTHGHDGGHRLGIGPNQQPDQCGQERIGRFMI